MLGQISYSMYLLHGLVLFVVFKFFIGFENAASITALDHWLIISVCSILLILLSALSFRFVEAPGMKLSYLLNAKIKKAYSGGAA